MRGPIASTPWEGMFAFAIWDRERQILFTARDRMGEKPLYYTTLQNGVFAFTSELTAFSRLPLLRLEVKKESIARFLTYKYVPTPDSIYREVFKLRPGHHLVFADGQVTSSKVF